MINKTDGVCGGSACLGCTRIAVWQIEEMLRAGCSHSDVIEAYPGLSHIEVQAAAEYAQRNTAEIEKDIADVGFADDSWRDCISRCGAQRMEIVQSGCAALGSD